MELLGASKAWPDGHYELKVDGIQNAYKYEEGTPSQGTQFIQVSNLDNLKPGESPNRIVITWEKNVPADPTFLPGTTHLKDPDVVSIPLSNGTAQNVMFLGDYNNDLIKGYVLNEDGSIKSEFAVQMPDLGKGKNRWAPDIVVKDDKIYMYYAQGDDLATSSDISSYRIYMVEATLSQNVSVDSNNNISSITFSNERLVDLVDFNNWGGRTDYGIIDPEVFVGDDGQIYMYYNVVLPGTSDSPYEEFIRCQPMTDYSTPAGQAHETMVYNGLANSNDNSSLNIDDGVAEAATVFKYGDKYIMLISSYPTDKDQCIIAIQSDDPSFKTYTNRTVVLGSDPAKDPWKLMEQSWATNGVGGQAINISASGDSYQVYFQGLSAAGFQLGVIDIKAFLEEYVKK